MWEKISSAVSVLDPHAELPDSNPLELRVFFFLGASYKS